MMFEYLGLMIKLYFFGILIVFIFAFSMSYYIELSFIFTLICSIVSLFFLSLLVKNAIYYSIAKKTIAVKEKEIEQDIENLDKDAFADYIEKQENLPLIKGAKNNNFGYIINQVVFEKKCDKKNIAINKYKKKFGEDFISSPK